MALGLTDDEIATRLWITRHSVRSHMVNAKRRLGARSRAHTVVLWLAQEV